MDPYKILGIKKHATAEQIKKAYRRMATKHHPDKTGGGDDNQFKELVCAYKILSDPDKRSRFDKGETVDSINKAKMSEEQEILAIVLSIFVKVVEMVDPIYTNILEEVKRNIVNNVNELKKQIASGNELARKFQTVIKKLNVKEGEENILAQSAQAQIDAVKRTLLTLESKKAIFEGAIKFIEPYSYMTDPKKQAEGMISIGEFFANLNSGGTFSTGSTGT